MKDYYSLLKVPSSATSDEIKKAYQAKVRKYHPDKIKDLSSKEKYEQRTRDLNEAYETLSDDSSRSEYDKLWDILYLSEDVQTQFKPAGLLTYPKPPFSFNFEKQHQSLMEYFRLKPIKTSEAPDQPSENKAFLEWISKMKAKERLNSSVSKYAKAQNNSEHAVEILCHFFNGVFSGSELRELLLIMKDQLDQDNPGLYEPVYQILAYCLGVKTQHTPLLYAFNRISAFMKELAQKYDPKSQIMFHQLTAVFAGKPYRSVHALALEQFWNAPDCELDSPDLQALNGLEQARQLLDDAKEKLLATNADNKELKHLMRLYFLLARYEKAIHDSPDETERDRAQFYREKGYLTLNWVPVFARQYPLQIICNTLLQAGLFFLKSAREEQSAFKRMADEKLAFRIFLLAYTHAEQCPPDERLILIVYSSRLISQFQYIDPETKGILAQLKQMALHLADFYPFVQPCQSNAALLQKQGQSLIFLRKYLHTLIAFHEKHPKQSKVFDLEYVDVLYQIYEACLHRWYETDLNPETESQFRSTLMQELLRVNRWTFADVRSLLMPRKAVSAKRTHDAWIEPGARILHFPEADRNSVYFSTMNGIRINRDKGEIAVIATPWKNGNSEQNKLFSSEDIEEILTHRVISAEFSLDPPDPYKPYHPFNKLEFAPGCLHETQLLHAMLIADLLLKYLTTGVEVQATEPFDRKSVDGVYARLPLHLKKIISDFRASKHSGEINRFWISVEEMLVGEKELTASDQNVEIALGQVKMCVKKHRMRRNEQGKLVDVEKDDEGYDMYISDRAKQVQLNKHLKTTDRPAIIWINNTDHFYFYQDGGFSPTFSLAEPKHRLANLFKLARDQHGKVMINDLDSELYIYHLTRIVAKKTKQEHLFSAEYIFAKEFSVHFNEFAQHFPILARLRELSKVVLMTRILYSHFQGNVRLIEKITQDLNDTEQWEAVRNQERPRINKIVQKLLSSDPYNTHMNKTRANLENIFKQTRNWDVDEYSPEMIQLLEENKERIINQYGYQAWEQNKYSIQDRIKELAQETRNTQYQNFYKQLSEIFDKQLSYGSKEEYIRQFLCGEPESLTRAVLEHEEQEILSDLTQNYPGSKQSTIKSALQGNSKAIQQLQCDLLENLISQIKESRRNQLNKLKRLDAAFKKMGLGKDVPSSDLSAQCLWVPASIAQEHNKEVSALVYGGVQVAGSINAIKNACLNHAGSNTVTTGVKVYRIWDGTGALKDGRSWTPHDPRSLANPRNALGLPDQNKGRFVTEGYLTNPKGVMERNALPIGNNKGGAVEYVIPNPNNQVRITRVSGVNPPY